LATLSLNSQHFLSPLIWERGVIIQPRLRALMPSLIQFRPLSLLFRRTTGKCLTSPAAKQRDRNAGESCGESSNSKSSLFQFNHAMSAPLLLRRSLNDLLNFNLVRKRQYKYPRIIMIYCSLVVLRTEFKFSFLLLGMPRIS